MKKMKLALAIAVAVVVALLAGWFWGSVGRSQTARALQASELRGDVLAARAAVLDARVAIDSSNFGEASAHLDDAKRLLNRVAERFKSLGRDDEAARVQMALSSIDEAQGMAGRLDQAANARAGVAAKILSEMADASTAR